jgi:hypothetical protein
MRSDRRQPSRLRTFSYLIIFRPKSLRAKNGVCRPHIKMLQLCHRKGQLRRNRCAMEEKESHPLWKTSGIFDEWAGATATGILTGMAYGGYT